ncbi:aa3-type cytochrome c oxidase subunit IV [Devosia sp. YIM 151766]|uniref:aa3-type cytochrome c oxidase subunit IV n=1 Tax=Devosia sp. YIM 151766 TaxID=3017325 RepID=UPI00255CF273|nr:aa3-type cytochrome c oxidase subunit IV [Devosia sp. YIM 151766]WIY52298.1 aa3-type cytochrome c oxidase subunit IV [Devosia sp. YIM 151766]
MAKKTAEPHPAPVLESAMDYAEHERTYSGFVTGVKWAIYGSAATMVILYFLIIH